MEESIRQIILTNANWEYPNNRLTDFICDFRNVTDFLSDFNDYRMGLAQLMYSGQFSTFLEDKYTRKSQGFIKLGFFSPKTKSKQPLTTLPKTYYLPYDDFESLN